MAMIILLAFGIFMLLRVIITIICMHLQQLNLQMLLKIKPNYETNYN
jgi:hypothetical protein